MRIDHGHGHACRHGGWMAGRGGFGRGGFDLEDMAREARGGRGGGGGRRRMFDGGELRLVLLKLTEDQPRHGYDLIRAIEERTGGAYAPSPGVIYPTLTLLEDMGLIGEHKAEGVRKLYAITDEGRAHLTERADEVAALFARLDAIAGRQRRSEASPVRRAVHNLRNVLHQRMDREEVASETAHEIAGMIDELARRIERL